MRRHALAKFVEAGGLWILAVCCDAGCGLAPGSGDPRASGGRATPTLVVAPEDGTTALLEAVRRARRRVLVTMYMLTADDAVAALVAAHDAGRQVRVLLEAAPYGDEAANQPAFAALAGAGIDVRWIARPTGLVHAKLIAVDGTTAWVLTLNLTRAGLGGNREYAVADTDPVDVRWAEAIWNADALGADPGRPPPRARLIASPLDARARLTALVDGARASVAIEIEEISDPELTARLLAARARGVAVHILAPASNASAATLAALARLAAGGVTVRALGAPTLHAKAMVIDRRQVYLGSVNFTRASFDDNRELGLILEDPAVVARVDATITADLATAAAF